jgi:hypothetical protein
MEIKREDIDLANEHIIELEKRLEEHVIKLKKAQDEARDNSMEAYRYKTAFEMLVKELQK